MAETVTIARNGASGMTLPAPGHADHEPAAQRAPHDARATGLLLDRYELLGRLGAGGFATVWEAHDTTLDRSVAIKIIPREACAAGADDPRAVREAQAAARLSHPAIVGLYEASQTEEATYLVSELVRGATLAELLHDGVLTVEDCLEIAQALCEALDHAHQRGVIHRDIKPQNVIVPDAWLEHGEGPPAKLTDFGVASVAGQDILTRAGDIVGTFAYMSPEQYRGRRAGAPADVYSLALVVYEALTGTNPVRGRTPVETARRIGSRLAPLRKCRPDVDAGVCSFVDAALAREPTRRPPLRALHAAFAAALSASVPAVDRPEHQRPVGSRLFRREHYGAGSASVGSAAPHGETPAGRTRVVLARLAAGVGAGSLLAAALTGLGPREPRYLAAIAAGAALSVAALPRVAWLAGAVALIGWLVQAGRSGEALLVAGAVVVTVAGLRGRRLEWSMPALAPALGWIGLAGVFPVLAARAPTAGRRALMGGVGAAWLLLAEGLTHAGLLVGPAPSTAARGTWEHSVTTAVDRVLLPLLQSGLTAFVLLWALAAAVLPVLVRGRRLSVDLAAAVAWATGLALASAELERRIAAPGDPAPARGAVAAACVGAVAAVLVARIRRPPSSTADSEADSAVA